MDSFGCCSSFRECSRLWRCIHIDEEDYMGCYYRTNLEQGKNFYYQEDSIMELKITITNASEFVQAINNLSEALKGIKSEQPAPVKTTKKAAIETKPVIEEKPAPAPVVVEEKPAPAPVVVEEKPAEPEFDDFLSDPEPEKTFTFDEVKAKLAKLSQSGKQSEMKQLIISYGVTKLSDIPAEKYAELMKKAEAIA